MAYFTPNDNLIFEFHLIILFSAYLGASDSTFSFDEALSSTFLDQWPIGYSNTRHRLRPNTKDLNIAPRPKYHRSLPTSKISMDRDSKATSHFIVYLTSTMMMFWSHDHFGRTEFKL